MIDKITPQIAALYLGQKCEKDWLIGKQGDKLGPIDQGVLYWLEDSGVLIIPHLRRLESITEDEAKQLYKGCDDDKLKPFLEWCRKIKTGEALFTPTAWLYLLSKGFDLFGLIDAGLAKEITING